jgi:hypothetical protein
VRSLTQNPCLKAPGMTLLPSRQNVVNHPSPLFISSTCSASASLLAFSNRLTRQAHYSRWPTSQVHAILPTHLLKLNFSQLGPATAANLHPKSIAQKNKLAYIFGWLLVTCPVTRPYYRPHHCSITFASAFLPSLPGCRLIMGVGALTIFSGRLHQRQRHFRLIAGTGGCIDRVSGTGENWLAIQRYGRHIASLQSPRELQWEKCLNVGVILEARSRLDGHLA